MRIVHLSDTHNYHNKMGNLPEGDILIHSGDFSFAGSENEAMNFIEWLISQSFKYKIFIPGNHDNYLYEASMDGLPNNCFYLSNTELIIQDIKFYGLSMFMEDVLTNAYDEYIRAIPADTNILISHQPPYGILDFSNNVHYGSNLLLETVLNIVPQYHLFGHIHDAYGTVHQNGTVFSNASIVNDQYEVSNKPFIFDI